MVLLAFELVVPDRLLMLVLQAASRKGSSKTSRPVMYEFVKVLVCLNGGCDMVLFLFPHMCIYISINMVRHAPNRYDH